MDPGHVYHLFPVRSAHRSRVQSELRHGGVETLIHYPVPIPQQPALAAERPAHCPVAARVCQEIFSLPLHPALDDDAVGIVAGALAREIPAAGASRAHDPADR